jgi:precorrin-3B synthase
MEAADGLLLRVRPPAGRLTAADLRALARIGREYGNGAAVLTRRGRVELRGLADGAAAVAALRAAGLAGAAVPVDLMVSPAGDLDPDAVADVAPLSARVADALADEPRLVELPAKTAVVLDGGGHAHVAASEADVRFDALRAGAVDGDVGAAAYRVAVAGSRSSATTLGTCREAAVPAIARTLLGYFQDRRTQAVTPPRRVRELLGANGPAAWRALVAEQLLSPEAPEPACPATATLGAMPGWYGVAFAFGRLDAKALEALATAAERFGTGEVRILPTRRVLVAGAGFEAAPALRAAGGIDEPGDVRLGLEACSGLGGCARATTATRKDALALAQAAPTLLAAGAGRALHVSGCLKGCACSAPARVMLTARDGVYDLALQARPTDEPRWCGLGFAEAAGHLRALEAVLERWRDDHETLDATIERLGTARLGALTEEELGRG